MRRSLLTCFLILVLLSAGCSRLPPAEKPQVITHPDGPLYVGDQVSFEVLAGNAAVGSDSTVEVKLDGKTLGDANYGSYGLGGREEAALWWVWDTRDLKAGSYTLTFVSHPDNSTWTESYTLYPASRVPLPEPGAHWVSFTTSCCILHYITGTDAERDIATLGREADAESAAVAIQMGAHLDKPLDLVFMPRLIGQGGFTWGAVYATYSDNNIIGNDMPILFHHEFVHYYDAAVGGGYRPVMLEEGLAVYLSGGHFKPEPLAPRAAALLDLGWYIPLTTVADDFYNQQHDIAYLEGATVVKYLVDTYGWQAFTDFFRSMPQPDGRKDSEIIDYALRQHFDISFADLETAYLASLRTQKPTDAERTDLQLTVEFFDAVRRYQQTLDPSAYYLTAWLPDATVMVRRGIVADLLRGPEGWKNRLVEFELKRTQQELFSGDYRDAAGSLKWSNLLLDLVAP